ILDKLERLGIEGAEVASELPQRPNVLVRLRGTGPGPTLLYIAHTDTKPVGGARAQWDSDPFVPTIRDGRLYGVGSADMKAAVAAFIYCAAALKQIEPMHGDLLLALVADEEGGGRFGAHFLSTAYGLKADMALIGEPPGITREWEYMHIGCRGVCCFTIGVHGTQMHSSLSDRFPSVNASIKMAELMLRMQRELKLTYAPHPFCPGGVTMNLGVKVKGGVYYGVYPGYAEFSTDIRVIPGMEQDRVAKEIQAFLQQCQRDDPSLKVDLQFREPPADWIAPTEVDPGLPLVGALGDACQEVLGFRPPLSIYPAGTDSPKFQLLAGIPTIPSFGAGLISVAHGPNEWVGTETIVEACKIYALAAHRILSSPANAEAAA
ncbi:MAG: M20 family metallopeptidase, partial [Acidobacteriaceae bacterium]|nr:M20 family metallopeptidase [Acidobacteriaceae bacterium]